MSELLKQIKSDQVQARKDGDKSTATALTTLLGEASPSGKETITDQQVQAVLKKFVKNLDEMLSYAKTPEDEMDIINEITLYKDYLPEQITGVDLEGLISSLINVDNCDNIGKVMKELNKNYKGMFDGKEASTIAKSML